jgi:hypothetical protein
MKEFKAQTVSFEDKLRTITSFLVVCAFSLILINVLRGFNLFVNILLIVIILLVIIHVYFIDKEVVSACIINYESRLFLVRITKGKESREIVIPFDNMSFVYQYERQSQYAASPVLSVYDNTKMVTKLIVNKVSWDEIVVKEVINELTSLGIKGKVTKTDQAGTDLFDYIN